VRGMRGTSHCLNDSFAFVTLGLRAANVHFHCMGNSFDVRMIYQISRNFVAVCAGSQRRRGTSILPASMACHHSAERLANVTL